MKIFKYLTLVLVLGAFLAIGLPLAYGVSQLEVSISEPADDSDFNVGQTITFEANATGGVSPYTYNWTYGDGTQGFGQTATKDYDQAGTKTVTVVATDFNETQATSTITVNIIGSLTISNVRVTDITSSSAVIRWETNKPASSRVIYDTASHPDISEESAPNFGYANSTATINETDKVTEHAVTITGLSANTRYYFRAISQ